MPFNLMIHSIHCTLKHFLPVLLMTGAQWPDQ